LNIWIAAWLFSLASSFGVYYFTRKARISRVDCVVLAIASFSSPLFRLISSTNSFIYGIDFVTPFAIFLAHRSWNASHPKVRLAAAALYFAAGISPLMVTLVFSNNPLDVQFDYMNAYRLMGAMALMISVLAGSKTTLVIIGASMIIVPFVFRGIRQILGLVVLGTLIAIIVWNIDIDDARRLLPRSVVMMLDSTGQDRPTLDSREQKWLDALDSVSHDPLILLGAARRESMPVDPFGLRSYEPAFYHNEYLSIVMLGGLWSIVTYVSGLALLLSLLLRHRSGNVAQRFGLMVLAGGLIEGFSGAHIQSGIIYGAAVSTAAAIYGFGCPALRRPIFAARSARGLVRLRASIAMPLVFQRMVAGNGVADALHSDAPNIDQRP